MADGQASASGGSRPPVFLSADDSHASGWPEGVREKLTHLPPHPGVYLMKDAQGRVIYVGKAASLRARVRSYFQSSRDMHVRTATMVSKIADFDIISTDTEMEALMLESNLIKKHRPVFNVKMRDDKRYPMLEVTLGETWPRLRLVRRPGNKRSRFFGPYSNSQALRRTMKVLARAFRIRTCALPLDKPLDRPCLDFHIQQCTAPCTRVIGEEEYRASVRDACQFLEGHVDALLDSLRAQMQTSSDALDFERCIRLRNIIQAVEQVTERQKMITADADDMDVLGLSQQDGVACVAVLQVREGKLVDEQHFVLDSLLGHTDIALAPAEPSSDADEEAPAALPPTVDAEGRGGGLVADEGSARFTVRSFLAQYYGEGRFIPPDILIPAPIDDATLLEQWLTRLRTRMSKADRALAERAERALLAEAEPRRRAGERRTRVRLHVPRRGARRELLELAVRNAEQHLLEWRRSSHTQDQLAQTALDELQQALDLPRPPWRIECFDISNIQGKNPVASMVVFERGHARKSDYRRFKIRSEDTPDDFRMMGEVLTRRLAGRSDERKFPHLPDLLVVDGGKGQLGVAVRVLGEQGLQHVPVCGLAKQEETIILPDDGMGREGEGRFREVRLDMNAPALLLLRRIRDESHRFAITFHRELRGKKVSRSLLDHVAGIGKKRKRDLLKHFGSLGPLMDATVEAIQRVPGVGPRLAASIYEALHAPAVERAAREETQSDGDGSEGQQPV